MGKLADLASWVEKQAKATKDLFKPQTFKDAALNKPEKAEQMVQELSVYKSDWQPMLVALDAKLAKSDGSISKAEIAEAEFLFDQLGYDGEARKGVIELFNWAKNAPLTFYETFLGFKDYISPSPDLVELVLLLLFRMGEADGEMHAVVKENLTDACRLFGLSFEQCHECHRESIKKLKAIDEAYSLFGCSASDSDETIKERYRVLVKDYHPDRVTPKDLAPGFTSFAEEKFKKIQAAYELLIEKRQKKSAPTSN